MKTVKIGKKTYIGELLVIHLSFLPPTFYHMVHKLRPNLDKKNVISYIYIEVSATKIHF